MRNQQSVMRKSLPITEFRRGQIVTRLEPAKSYRTYYNANLGVEVETVERTDGSFRGKPLEFLGIENNMIYLKYKKGCMEGDILELEVEKWLDGWGGYIDPSTL